MYDNRLIKREMPKYMVNVKCPTGYQMYHSYEICYSMDALHAKAVVAKLAGAVTAKAYNNCSLQPYNTTAFNI